MLPTAPPYGPPQGDPTAVVWRRIGAYAIDLLINIIVLLVVLIPAFSDRATNLPSDRYRCAGTSTVDGARPGTFGDQRTVIDDGLCLSLDDEVLYVDQDGTNELTMLFYGVSAAVGVANLIILQGLTGASIGKLLVGLRVVRADGRTAHIGWAALRYVVLFVDSLCCFLPGAVLVFSTKGHRRLGDMAAGTFVVRRSSVGAPLAVPGIHTSQVGPYAGAPTGTPAYGSTATSPSYGQDRAPVWDDARNTYLQYDDASGTWLQWDAATSQWRPLDEGSA